MRQSLFTIYIILTSLTVSSQVTIDTTKAKNIKGITDTSQIKIVIRDGFSGEASYYLNGKKIDLSKCFITTENIKEVAVVKSEKAKQLFNDTAKGGLVLITTKPDLKFLTLIELLKLNSLDYYKLDPFSIEINGKQLLDTSTLIDSKAKVFPIYKKETGQIKPVTKKENIIGASIMTISKPPNKKYGR